MDAINGERESRYGTWWFDDNIGWDEIAGNATVQ